MRRQQQAHQILFTPAQTAEMSIAIRLMLFCIHAIFTSSLSFFQTTYTTFFPSSLCMQQVDSIFGKGVGGPDHEDLILLDIQFYYYIFGSCYSNLSITYIISFLQSYFLLNPKIFRYNMLWLSTQPHTHRILLSIRVLLDPVLLHSFRGPNTAMGIWTVLVPSLANQERTSYSVPLCYVWLSQLPNSRSMTSVAFALISNNHRPLPPRSNDLRRSILFFSLFCSMICRLQDSVKYSLIESSQRKTRYTSGIAFSG